MRVLVTGGGGFIGGGIARALAARGASVRSFSRKEHLELTAAGIESARGDLGDPQAVLEAADGCSMVFHVAALAGIWGSRARFERTNILGTEHVIAACRAHGISRLIFTSSPSVTFGGRDQKGVDESEPYPDRYLAHYPRTKAAAERLVRAAADDRLATVSIRPHLVWGPGDPHFLPRLIEKSKNGRLRLVGRGDSRGRLDLHRQRRRRPPPRRRPSHPGGEISGRAYFVSNGEPRPIGELLSQLLEAAGLPPVTRRVPTAVAIGAGAIFEAIYRALRIEREPPVTRFVARQLSTDHWFDLTAAKRDFGYDPQVSIDEGLVRLRASLAPGSAAPERSLE